MAQNHSIIQDMIYIFDALDSFSSITLAISSKMTELTESSPSVLRPSVLCGSDIFSKLGSPWSTASSGHCDESQTYDGYKAVEVPYPAGTEFLRKGKLFFQH
ncbi:hypothetical protein O181_108813 [Austropuccinia psidii MF-1]|uniref:Uncharacterized protein n=1 Tax=Austropuccinia psidii MF-1 TaxID=1389203 RepID=A0A9Q3JUW7_9BASI|nr:hypothetical protein [Austropuccinia psidii MF-1]